MSRRGRGLGPGPRPRLTAAQVPMDAILVESDNNNEPRDNGDETNSNTGAGAGAEGDTEPESSNFTIGVPAPNFSINDSVFYSHNYFQKVRGEDGKSKFEAKCLICLVEKKSVTLIKTTDNNTKG